ncbi:hypothetical protein OSB04_009378 [Centaurea solstitialis]|uniref:Fatty acyl-CoA reductase n=1 Tax=Centaurea solstitialis TaxID=347529 RepID=A0AA38WM31_9ASTR|nr:hypothetical protein OSB04_009378 [Centaurea solstitialis]
MEMESIIESLENMTILVTGATGFLAKIFVEKILRVQPNIKKLFLIVRASDTKMALHRFQSEVIDKELFRVIKEIYGKNLHTFISEKITVVAGDVSMENFGVTDFDLLNEMRRQVDVLINSAANTKFDERYDIALEINTFGSKHVYNFADQCFNMKLLLHVSTAYISGEKSGIILERPFKMGETLNGKNDLNIREEQNAAQERLGQLDAEKLDEEAISCAMKDFGIQRAKLHGWPNTYVFTKAMGEMLLLEGLRKDVSLVILRPTIITSTYKEPFPGWIEGIKTIDGYIVAFGKAKFHTFSLILSKYLTFYDDTNLSKLRSMANLSEMDTFYFDPKSLNWEDYFMNIHIPGLVKYAIKQ